MTTECTCPHGEIDLYCTAHDPPAPDAKPGDIDTVDRLCARLMYTESERDALRAAIDYDRETRDMRDCVAAARAVATEISLERVTRERNAARALLQSYHGWNTRDVDVIIEILAALEREPDVVFSVGVFAGVSPEPRTVKAGELAHAIRVAMSVGERASKRAIKLRAAMERIAATACFESDEMKARTAIAADDALKGGNDEP